MSWHDDLKKIKIEKKTTTNSATDSSSAIFVSGLREHNQGIPNHSTAPYNFVPLNEKIIPDQSNPGKKLTFDKYHEGKFTGYIKLEIETKTPCYIRDTLSQYDLKDDNINDGFLEKNHKGDKYSSNFFSPAEKFRIPGSSIRGMTRTIMEIITFGKFGVTEITENGDKKFHFRSFADKSIELQKKYQSKMMAGNKNIGYHQQVKGGYLIKVGREYKIKPAIAIEKITYFRVEEEKVIKANLLTEEMRIGAPGNFRTNDDYKIGYKKVKFTVEDGGPKKHPHSDNCNLYYTKVLEICDINKNLKDSKDSYEGTLVHSGWIPGKRKGKHMHWVIGQSTTQTIDFASGVIEDYEKDKDKHKDTDLLKYFKDNLRAEIPCFYITDGNGKVESFGHTGLFRLAYDKKLKDFLPMELSDKSIKDITEAVFGNENEFTGRAFFDDAMLILKDGQNEQEIFINKKQPKILSSPKPTTFNHYLVQPDIPEPEFNDIKKHDYDNFLDKNDQIEKILLNENYALYYEPKRMTDTIEKQIIKLLNNNNLNNFNINNTKIKKINGNKFQDLLIANSITEDQKKILKNNFEEKYSLNRHISSSDKTAILGIFWKYDKLDFISKYSKIRDWNSDDTSIRGNKLYWHRSGADWSEPNVLDDDQHTMIRPIIDGVTFSGKIRFENLSKIELGALLSALELPPDCCHKIGMGKPLGLGSIKIIPTLYLSNRKERYKNLIEEWVTEIKPSDKPDEKIIDFKKVFQSHVLEKLEETTITDLWEVERMKELKKMLEFPGPSDNKTRYMTLPPQSIKNEFKDRKILPKPTKVS